MLNVIIDSNIIISNFSLKYAAFSKFCKYFPERQISVYITKVSLEEIFKNYKKNYKEALGNFNKVSKELNKFDLGTKHSITRDIDKEVQKYQEYLYQLLRENNIKVMPYPRVSHEEIIKYSVTGKKPFKEKDTGYKDFLIWHSALSLLKESKQNMVVITKDSDFIDGKTVCQDFKDFLHMRGINCQRLEVMSSINEFNRRYINEIIEKVDIKRYLEKHENTKEFIEKFKDEFENTLEGSPLEAYSVNIPLEYENTYITYASYTDFIGIDDVEIYDDQHIFVSIIIRLDCEFEFFIYKSEYCAMSEEDHAFKVIDSDWNKHYVSALENGNFEIEYSIIINKDLTHIKQIDINDIRD